MSRRAPRLLPLFLLIFCSVGSMRAAGYRAYWVETFNTPLGTTTDINRVVQAAVDSNANQIFAQVRRRGDSWYLDSKEPLTQVAGVCAPSGGSCTVDPLKYLVEQAHLRGIEVHAYVIVGSIYNGHPTITGTPQSASHVFNRHFWQPGTTPTNGTQIPVKDVRNWGTRSLPHNPDGTTFNGQRYTAEWYVDLGHPEASAYTVDVLTHLVKKYDVDGLHLDRIRYPEAPINRPPGKPLEINVGYNETSVNRFKARFPAAPSKFYQLSDVGSNVNTSAAPRLITDLDVGYPKTGDLDWNNWRREQVTNFVRRLYLNATAIKPRIKVSAALICFWTGPVGSGGWERTEAYYRVFQDWKTWTEEGILDLVIPMAYKREHAMTGPPPTGAVNERAQYDDWISFTKKLASDNGRHSIIGLGNYLNGIEGTLIQQRKALGLSPFNSLPAADGVIYYALGNTVPNTITGNSTNVAVNPNPFSFPITNANSPKRPNEEFFSALRTGASRNGGLTRYEDPLLAPLNAQPILVPDMPWKSSPVDGSVMGFAKRGNGTPLDGAEVRIETLDGTFVRSVKTDGGGFFGALKLAPGAYRAVVTMGADTLYACPWTVSPGVVSTSDAAPDTTAPMSSSTLNGTAGSGGWYLSDVVFSISSSDSCSGVASTRIVNGGSESNYAAPVVLSAEGVNAISWYASDRAGNRESLHTQNVRIDKSAPVVSISTPANGGTYQFGSQVLASFSCQDSVSGISSCEGTSSSGAAIDTSSTGLKSFVVRGVDVAGRETSSTVTYRVVAPTTTVMTAGPNPSVSGQSVTFTATVASAAGVSSGMVTFVSGGTTLGSSPLSSGVAQLSVSNLAVGSHSVAAQYSGTADLLPSSSAVVTQVVNKGATAIDLSSRSEGKDAIFTAIVSAVSPASGVPTGEVEFFEKADDEDRNHEDKLKSLGRAPLINGRAELRVKDIGLKVVARYAGSSSFLPSESARIIHRPNGN